jgi:hypothetical protein
MTMITNSSSVPYQCMEPIAWVLILFWNVWYLASARGRKLGSMCRIEIFLKFMILPMRRTGIL